MNKAIIWVALIAALLLSLSSSLFFQFKYQALVNYLFMLFHKGGLDIMCKGFLFFPDYWFLFSFCPYCLAITYLFLESGVREGLKSLLLAAVIFCLATMLTSYIDVSFVTASGKLPNEVNAFINCRSINYSFHFITSAIVSILLPLVVLFLRKKKLGKA